MGVHTIFGLRVAIGPTSRERPFTSPRARGVSCQHEVLTVEVTGSRRHPVRSSSGGTGSRRATPGMRAWTPRAISTVLDLEAATTANLRLAGACSSSATIVAGSWWSILGLERSCATCAYRPD